MPTMFARHAFLPTVVSAGAIAVALAACAQTPLSQKLDVYEAALSGAQEVPPVTTSATGNAEVSFNSSNNQLTWRVTYSGLSGPATGAHIHGPAAAGQNAGVLVPFTNVTTQPISGQGTITAAQAADLAAGRWYVNVHTAANPGGEIRGQLRRRQ
jgi:hypothetical protein